MDYKTATMALCILVAASCSGDNDDTAPEVIQFQFRIEGILDNPVQVKAVDINQDDKSDVVVVDEDSNTVSVFLNQGDGTLDDGLNFGTVVAPESMATGDLNGDGWLDIVTANSSALGILLNNGSGEFAAFIEIPRTGFDLAVADFDGDGFDDIVRCGSSAFSSEVLVLLSDGSGGIRETKVIEISDTATVVAVGDLNGDALVDLVLGHGNDLLSNSGSISILLNSGGGAFSAPQVVPTPDNDAVFKLQLADINDDGNLDVLARLIPPGLAAVFDLCVTSSQIQIYLGDGNGMVQPQSVLQAGGRVLSLSVSDLNGDHLPDIVTAYGSCGGAGYQLNLGNNEFAGHVSLPIRSNVQEVVIADFDQDRLGDIATALDDNGVGIIGIFIQQ